MLKEVLEIYSKSDSIYSLESMDDLNYEIFSKKQGLAPSLVTTRKFVKQLRPLKQLYRFFEDNKNPFFWMIPIATPSKKIIGFIIRSFYDKYYMTLFDKGNISPLFGWEDFGTFKINNPVILCEGIKDAIFLKQYYPYVLSLNTSEITSTNLEILKKITSRIILCYDNDTTGINSSKSDCKLLKDNGFSCEIVLPKIKNGDCADYFKPQNSNTLKEFLYDLEFCLGKQGGNIQWKK